MMITFYVFDNWRKPGTKIWLNIFSSCINVLDDSMMEWYNKWDILFICVICKPLLFVNKIHTIAFVITTIL